MKSRQYASKLVSLAMLFAFAGCTDGGAGFTGRNDPDFGTPGGGAPPGGGVPPGGSWIEPRLTYQPSAGTRLFGMRISGVNLMVVFVSDEDPSALKRITGESPARRLTPRKEASPAS